MSLTRNIIKQNTIGRYEMFVILACIHKIISTISFKPYAQAKNGLRKYVNDTATKLVVTERVLTSKFSVLKALRMK